MMEDAFKEKCQAAPDDAANHDEDEPISKCIGEYGRWQLKHTFFVSFFTFSYGINLFSFTFTGAERDFWCSRPAHLQNLSVKHWKNFTSEGGNCQIPAYNWSEISISDIQNNHISQVEVDFIPCTNWEWDTDSIVSTVISEWNLICDRAHLATIIELVFLGGIAVGAIITGIIADRHGRKKTMIISSALQNITGLAMTFNPNFILYLLLKFISGFCVISVFNAGFILVVELVGGKWRTAVGTSIGFLLPISFIAVAGLSLLLPDWKHFQLSVALLPLPLLLLWWILPESPIWLLGMGRIDELKNILAKAANDNRIILPKNIDRILIKQKTTEEDKHVTWGVLDLFRNKMYRRTMTSFAGWFSATVTYYGLTLKMGSLGGNLYMTSFLSSLVEIPAIAVSVPILLRLGRRYPTSASFLVAGLCYVAAIFFEDENMFNVKLTVIMIGKFAAGFMNGVFPIVTAELFPPLIRNLGMGSGQLAAGLGLICVPYIWLAAAYYSALPMILMGVLSMGGCIAVLLLPETSTKPNRNETEDDLDTSGVKTISSAVDQNFEKYITRF